MKRKIMKKMVSSALVLAVAFGFSVTAFATASTVPETDETLLLEAVEPIITAYEKHYVVENVDITDVVETQKDDGGRYVEYLLTFDATLKYQSAMEIPSIKGMAKTLKIADNQSVDAFIDNLNSSNAEKIVNVMAQQKAKAMDAINMTAMDATADTTETVLMSNEAVADCVTDYVIDQIASYVAEIENEYIGESSEYNIGLRANIDGQGKLVKLEYGAFDGYTDNIAAVIPETEEAMLQSGAQQVEDITAAALSDVAVRKSASSVINPQSNPSFVYYRVDARDYANRYTSNAAETVCSTHNVKIRQAIGFYNTDYKHYCCNDCANYVSQAMRAGRVPTDIIWKPESATWINCAKLRSYFYQSPGYWNLSTFSNCNAGGVILTYKNSSTPNHAMMNVHNDGVARKLSGHTNDRKAFPYTPSFFTDTGVTKVEYFIFDNVNPAH